MINRSLYPENAYFWQDLSLQKSDQKKLVLLPHLGWSCPILHFPVLIEFKVIYVILCGVSYIPPTFPFPQGQLRLFITTLDTNIANVQSSSILNCHHFRPLQVWTDHYDLNLLRSRMIFLKYPHKLHHLLCKPVSRVVFRPFKYPCKNVYKCFHNKHFLNPFFQTCDLIQ